MKLREIFFGPFVFALVLLAIWLSQDSQAGERHPSLPETVSASNNQNNGNNSADNWKHLGEAAVLTCIGVSIYKGSPCWQSSEDTTIHFSSKQKAPQ
jgi:hypothetical protein